MRTRLFALFFLLVVSAPAFAGQQTCWYNEQGKNTGAVAGNTANKQIGKVVRINNSGPQSVAVVLDDKMSCPQTVRIMSGMGGLSYSN